MNEHHRALSVEHLMIEFVLTAGKRAQQQQQQQTCAFREEKQKNLSLCHPLAVGVKDCFDERMEKERQGGVCVSVKPI